MKAFFTKKLSGIFTVFAIMIIWGNFAKADVPAVHGMLLFGQQNTYASHLPMFHHPHDYQLIMELKLADMPRSQTLEDYELLKEKGETFFTLVPEKMDLSQVMNGKIKTFQALIYNGHFERGGKNLGPVKVTVKLIIYSKKLDPSSEQKTAEYFVFGKDGEYFAAHVIKSRPSFDSILSVVFIAHRGCHYRVCPDNDVELPLFLPSTASVPVEGVRLGQFGPFYVHIEKVIYFEEGDLQH